jgi:phosphoribosyl-dephospho-CoA transferase
MADYPLWRHTSVWIAAGQCTMLRYADEQQAIVADWLACDRPLIVRRAEGCVAAPAGWVALGLPLPPVEGVKQRIAIVAPSNAIRCSAPPPLLRDVVAHAPIAWRVALENLLRRADACGIALRVFGSAAWQALTGLPYLSAQSDLDLLWRPRDAAQLAAGVALLADWERASGVRADGEILFGDDLAVAWREWQQARQNDIAQVLVKSTTKAQLMDARALCAHLAEEPACV